MKSSSTRITFTVSLLFLFSTLVNSQTKYVFTGSTLISGTALSVGAVYQFLNVKSGVDATVRIEAITGGLSLSTIDGTGGFSQALQPTISVPAYSNGYVELLVTFLVAGTSTPSIQTEVPVTPIDVDGQNYGGLPLYEFDEIQVTGGYTYFQFAGSELTMTLNGTWARGKNNVAIDYPGIDTAQKQVMYTTVNSTTSSIRVRVGADNQSGSNTSRLRSLYFEKFNYPHTVVLSKEPVINFSGVQKGKDVDLNGSISDIQSYNKLVIERSTNGANFIDVTKLSVTERSNDFQFSFRDISIPEGKIYYRLRLINTGNNTEKISAVIVMENRSNEARELNLVNSIVNLSDPAIVLQSKNDGNIDFYIYDMSGRIVCNRAFKIHAGVNLVHLTNSSLGKGNFVIVIRQKDRQQSYKISVR